MNILWLRAALLAAVAAPACAVNVVIDYTYDTNGFFNPGTTNGAAARAALEEAASFFSDILGDSFSSIETPDTFRSSTFGGEAVWSWSARFNHPSTGALLSLDNLTIPTDEYRLYAGARSISGSTLGIGGPGGYAWGVDPTGGFTSSEISQINSITSQFESAVVNRGEPDGEFAAWGGAITFDNDSSTQWHFDHTSNPAPNENDFFSVVLHEMGHALGLGASAEWTALVSGGVFVGAEATAANGGVAPTVNAAGDHWASNTTSTVYGGFASQETALDPELTRGNRKLFTLLDAAALSDIGWDVADGTPLPGDYNSDGLVDAADYTVWRDALGSASPIGSYSAWAGNYGASAPSSGAAVPEPGAAVLAAFALIGFAMRRG